MKYLAISLQQRADISLIKRVAKPKVRAWAPCFLAVEFFFVFVLLPSSAVAQTIASASNTRWADVTQAQCLNQASSAIDNAGEIFDLPFDARVFDGWLVTSRLGDTVVNIVCAADEDSSRLVSAEARRVLVHIDVATLRESLDGRLRDFLEECFHYGRCVARAAGGPGTDPEDEAQPIDGPPVDRQPVSQRRCNWRPPQVNLGISGQNDVELSEMTVDECKSKCLTDPDFMTWCRSMEYIRPRDHEKDGSCYLSKRVAGQDGFVLQKSGGIDYYDYECVFVEAIQGKGSTSADLGPSTVVEVHAWRLDYGRLEFEGTEIVATPANDGHTSYFVAPGEMLGDWRSMSVLSFQKKSWGGNYYGPDAYGAYGDVVISNRKMKARYDLVNAHSGSWESHSLMLDSSNWALSGGARAIEDVLTNVTEVRIRAEYGAGDDYSALRGVRLLRLPAGTPTGAPAAPTEYVDDRTEPDQSP